MAKDFRIGKPKKTSTKKPTQEETTTATVDTGTVKSFIDGKGREVTKTFRISEDLAFLFKKYAVECRQTEKDILINIITQHLKTAGQL